MPTLLWILVAVAMPLAAHASQTTHACCLANGTCQDLSMTTCESNGGLAPGPSTCAEIPGFCIGCCRSGSPVTCEDDVTFVDCNSRTDTVQYGSPAVCDANGDCTASGPTATPTVTATSTLTATSTATATNTPVPQGGDCTTPSECGTDFCVDGVCCDTICDQPGQVCNQAGNRGVCTVASAPAPTLTPWGLLFALAVLGGLAAVALRRRQALRS